MHTEVSKKGLVHFHGFVSLDLDFKMQVLDSKLVQTPSQLLSILRACSHDPGTTHCPGATH